MKYTFVFIIIESLALMLLIMFILGHIFLLKNTQLVQGCFYEVI